MAARARCDGYILRNTVLFDVFRAKKLKAGEEAASGALAQDEKSSAVRLTLGSDTASLTDAEIDAAMQGAIAALVERMLLRACVDMFNQPGEIDLMESSCRKHRQPCADRWRSWPICCFWRNRLPSAKPRIWWRCFSTDLAKAGGR